MIKSTYNQSLRTEDAKTLALVALAHLPRVGERTLIRVQQLARWQGLPLPAVLTLPPALLLNEYRLSAVAVTRLTTDSRRHMADCQQILARLRAVHGRVSHPSDSAYPWRWRERVVRPPPVAYFYGSQRALRSPTLAILHSRDVREDTVAAIAQVSCCAADDGFALVAGGMKIPHRIAAVTIRATGAPRTIVLDRGLFAAFGTHFDRDPFGFGPGRAHFDPEISLVALADIIVAVSARPGGEVERTCLRALDRGQSVLSWEGANPALLAAGAAPIDDGDLCRGLRPFLAND